MVIVLDRNGAPLMPCAEKRARQLLERGRAKVRKIQPFTICIIDRNQTSCSMGVNKTAKDLPSNE